VSAPVRTAGVRRLLPRLSERDWRVLDRVFALLLLIGIEVELQLSNLVQGPMALNMVLCGAMALAFLARREQPLVTVVVVFAGAAIGEAFLSGPPEMFVQVVMVLSASYSVGAHAERRPALIGLAIAVTAVVVLSIFDDPNDIFWPVMFFVFVPWLVGRTMRNQLHLARELAEKADRAEHAREEEERRAIAEERSRIARELHDVLAHNLSVMVVQAGAARRIVERDPDTAADAAELIRTTGREALAELRQVFGPVRRGDGEPLAGPPSLANLDRLASRAREAGLPVQLRVEGAAVQLPTGVDLTAYRVVQEALTNAVKHAGDARATVTVRYEPWEVVVEVEDDGVGPEARGALSEVGGGHGLVGMRERVSLYGGRLQAGRRRGGGFAVRARLPTLSTSKTEVVA
jgi:signal transduction histidine kinase